MKTLRHKRTLTSLLLAVGALILGLIAQGFFVDLESYLPRSTPVDGLLVYVGVVAMFAAAVMRTPPPPTLSSCAQATRPKLDARRTTWAVVLLLVSGGALILALLCFGDAVEPSMGWLLYLGSILVFAVALSVLAPTGRQIPQDQASEPGNVGGIRFEWIALALILLVGAFFRLYRFTEVPYGLWYDEADNGLWARQILANPQFRPVYVPSTNLPAHFLYLVALSFRLLGDSMHAIRAVAVVFGMLTIVAAYFCGRELFGATYGSGLGLALATLVAVTRWDVNWSRVGMHGVTLPFFEFWVVAALLRGLRTGRWSSFGWAGIAAGLGLCFYSPFRVFPAVLLAFLVAWLWRWVSDARRRNPGWGAAGRARHLLSTWSLPLLLLILGALIAVAPVAQFAIRHPDLFWDRAKSVSVFSDPSLRARPVATVVSGTVQHLLMFNYRGDPNGRHNLPGAPMLDHISAVLFVLGVVLCVLRWRTPRAVLLLLWLLISLSGGILSTRFEAPQSLRSIGSLPAVCALICLPMEWFAGEWFLRFPKVRATASRRWALSRPLHVVAVLVLSSIGLMNGVIYFRFWAGDFASWAAFNPAETSMAQDIRRYGERYDLRFDPLLTAHLATRYLNPDFGVYHHFDPATVFPIRGTDREGMLLFIAPDTRFVRQQASALYPGVQTEAFAHPDSGNVVLHKYIFTQDAIAGAQGLDASYAPWRQEGAEGLSRVDAEIDFAWDDRPPLAYPFLVTWVGGLLAPTYGLYALHVEVQGDLTLELDDQILLDGPGPQSRQIVMARGVHTLRLECRVTGPGRLRLIWQTPEHPELVPVPSDALYRPSWTVRGLLARLYANADWSGVPAFARIDRQVAYYFHFLPLARPYTVEWVGRLAAPVSGSYRLGVQAVSSASLYIDGWPLVEHSPLGRYVGGEVYLEAGMHDIQVRYLDDEAHSQIYLYWQLPEEDLTVIPPDVLYLPAEGAWWPG